MEETPLDPQVPPPRTFPTGPGGIELTYDPEGNELSPGQRGSSFALIGEGPHAKVYRGRTGIGDVALKVQKEVSPEGNSSTEGRWGREFEALSRYGGEEPGLLAVEPIPGFEGEDEPPSFEPLFICRERGILFPLPCPRCMRVHTLADCRDGEALRAAGLPPWSTSKERFVWCSACGREEPAFYARTKGHASPKLSDFVGLVDALRTVVDRGADSDPVASEIVSGLEQDFPCMTCEFRATCHPRPDAEEPPAARNRLAPFSMNEFHAWPLPLCTLAFDEAADLLSGTPPGELSRMHSRSWKNPAVRRMKEDALSRGSPPDALQALAAKVDLYAQAVQSVHRLHVMSGTPHLAISPAHLLVDPGTGGTPLVRLAAPGAARPLMDLTLPPPEPMAPYAAPAMRDERFGREYSVRVHIGKVWSSDTGTFFACVLKGDGLPVDDIAVKDEICLTLKDEGWEGVRIWSRPLSGAQARPEPGSLGVVTEPEDLDETQVNDLNAARGKSPMFGTTTIHRDFGIPFDVYALGMILFRTFLVNEAQSFTRVVEEVVLPLTASIELYHANRPDADFETMCRDVRSYLEDEPFARPAGPGNVWHSPGDAAADRIPRDAWYDLLLAGLRAVTFVPGFSYVSSDREQSEEAGAPTLALLEDLDRIGERVAGALLSPTRDDQDEVMSVRPLTDKDLERLTGEVHTRMGSELAEMKEQLDRARAEAEGLREAWARLYESVVGKPDPESPPTRSDDGRIALLSTTVEEAIESITYVFRSIGSLTGDELGENFPKIRVIIQDALFKSGGGKVDPARGAKMIRRQLKALRMVLLVYVQTIVEANSQSTKLGTRSLMDMLEKKLFAPIVKGRRERAPDVDEIQRRFAELKETLPQNHHRIFQPFFTKYVKRKLQNLS